MCSNYNVPWKSGSSLFARTTGTRRPVRLLLFASAALLGASGAASQLQKQVGSFLITLSTTPAPLQVGLDNVSVAVQRLKGHSVVPDANVLLHFRKSDPNNIVEVMARAKPATISNKLAYVAQVTIPSAGSWNVSVEVSAHAEEAAFSANVDVLPREDNPLPHWPYFVVLPLIVLLLVWIRWLKRERRLRRSQAPP